MPEAHEDKSKMFFQDQIGRKMTTQPQPQNHCLAKTRNEFGDAWKIQGLKKEQSVLGKKSGPAAGSVGKVAVAPYSRLKNGVYFVSLIFDRRRTYGYTATDVSLSEDAAMNGRIAFFLQKNLNQGARTNS